MKLLPSFSGEMENKRLKKKTIIYGWALKFLVELGMYVCVFAEPSGEAKT